MTKEFSLFAKDGLKINGLLPEDPFSNIAKEITNGYMSLYFQSTPTSIILGSCFNLKRTSGGREEGFIVIGKFTYDEFKQNSIEFIQTFLIEAMEFIRQSGYDVIDLYGETRILDNAFTISKSPGNEKFANITSGKIFMGKSSFIYSTDALNSLSFFSYCIETIKPVLTLEYTIIISKLIVPASLIICSNKHPDESEIDIDLDLNMSKLSDDDQSHYEKLGEYSHYTSLQKITSKDKIVKEILRKILSKQTDETKLKILAIDWNRFLYEKRPVEGINISLTAREAVDELSRGRRKYFQIYVNSNFFNAEKFRAELSKYTKEDLNEIRKIVSLEKTYPSHETESEIINILDRLIKEKTLIIPDFTPRYKPDTSVYPLPKKRNNRRKIALFIGLIVLIVALSLVILNFLPSENQSRLTTLNCTEDYRNFECKFNCCIINSNDNGGQLFIPTKVIDNSTTITITPNPDMNYMSKLSYQNLTFRLQDNITYHIIINNLTSSSIGAPQLKIKINRTINFNKVFIWKYDKKTGQWNTSDSEPNKEGSNTITLENNVDDSFGLFIGE